MRDAPKKSTYKPRAISGFPEWLPEVRRVEQQWFDHIRRVFESYGFCSIETPSVEELDVLTAKGEVDKEIYVIERLHKDEGDKEARLALHFDQTVPLARYVAQHFNDLVFPFKRYQMQRVWRGERPQAGRFREFYQCDIDVINVDGLPLHFDAELPAIIWGILSELPGMENEKFQIQISNRKILIGYLEGIGVTDPDLIIRVLRVVDKFLKISETARLIEMREAFEGSQWTIETFWPALNEFITLVGMIPHKTANSLKQAVAEWEKVSNRSFDNLKFKTGIDELCQVLENLSHIREGDIVANLMIVRGLDYYTGTVYETVFTENPRYGSICSGGRYDDLAGSYINKHLPGVGISIGFSRLFDYLREKNILPVGRKTTTDILLLLFSEELRAATMAKAAALRAQGWNVEVYHSVRNPKKQFEYAEKKGIPLVYLIANGEQAADEIKNIATREQAVVTDALLAEWKRA